MLFRLLLFICFTTILMAQTKSLYDPFIEKQIELTLALDNNKTTEKEIDQIIEEKNKLFNQRLQEILVNKDQFLQQEDPYSAKIYRLQKIINVNKVRGNKYAVLRDQVLIKSYKILESQIQMMQRILKDLDSKTFEEFQKKLDKDFEINQKEISHINDVDYTKYLSIHSTGSVIQALKQRIREYYAILELNEDILKKLSDSQRKLYRLNKYYKYGLIKPVLYINNLKISQELEPILMPFNLSVVKIILIAFVILLIYFFKQIVFRVIKRFLRNLEFKYQASKDILDSITRPIEILAITVGINLIIYIYNDFSQLTFVSAFIDMIYVVIIMWMIYRVLNILVAAKINAIATRTKNVKHELVNITIKIMNFMLLLITVLIILHLAGVNLTAILSGLGIGGFAVALAAKDSIANFFGTLSILLSDTFSQGDWIVIEDMEGIVVEIGLRVTTIRTFENALISMPNSKLANEAIKNWSKRKVGRRIKFIVSLRYDSSPEAIEKTLEDIRLFLVNHPGIAKKQNTQSFSFYHTPKLVSQEDSLGIKNFQLVALDKLADSSIDIMVYCFSTTIDWAEWAKVKDEVILGVMKIVESNGLDFAFPSLSLYPEGSVSVNLDTDSEKAIPAIKPQH
ncbi:MAG: mechanosensitive ion channel [Epsilonproteobacteria bacterium]|nr:mechanosensitive ion channel [Campylobacterota bacterium]